MRDLADVRDRLVVHVRNERGPLGRESLCTLAENAVDLVRPTKVGLAPEGVRPVARPAVLNAILD